MDRIVFAWRYKTHLVLYLTVLARSHSCRMSATQARSHPPQAAQNEKSADRHHNMAFPQGAFFHMKENTGMLVSSQGCLTIFHHYGIFLAILSTRHTKSLGNLNIFNSIKPHTYLLLWNVVICFEEISHYLFSFCGPSSFCRSGCKWRIAEDLWLPPASWGRRLGRGPAVLCVVDIYCDKMASLPGASCPPWGRWRAPMLQAEYTAGRSSGWLPPGLLSGTDGRRCAMYANFCAIFGNFAHFCMILSIYCTYFVC